MKLARRKFLHLAASAATLPAMSRSRETQGYPTLAAQSGRSKVRNMIPMVAAVALIGLAAPSDAQQATTKEQLIGTWKFLSLKAITGNNVSYPFGEKVAGYVTITPDRMWALVVDSTRKAPAAAALTDAESIAMMKSHGVWTGKYTTAEQTADGIKLTAHVDAASNEAINNTDRVYFMRVNGNKLTVKSPSVIVPVTGAASLIEVESVKAD